MKPQTEIKLEGGVREVSRDPYHQIMDKFEAALKNGNKTITVLKAAGGHDTYPEDSVEITIVVDKVLSIQRVPR